MPKLLKNIFLFSFVCFCGSNLALAEDITITTYYPSPYGSYSSLQTDKLGVGDNSGDSNLTSADVPTTSGNVWIAGRVGIGTTTPGGQLEIGGSGGGSFLVDNAGDFYFGGAGDVYLESCNKTRTASQNMHLTGNAGNAMTLFSVNATTSSFAGTVRATVFSATTAGVGAYQYNTSSNMNVPDYVFEKNYKLMPLSELKKYVLANKHLPGLLSSEEIKKSGTASLVEQDFKNLEKIEELVLYILQLQSDNEKLQSRVEKLEAKLKTK